ncbi:shikimate dehydrogenase [Actinomadura darangshiensis]|uniref:Shikimate dehydrogenase n=1 Tax=Actinomadura darangshiensis TaxID=705336 RepID=A0A4R5B1H6_9ACTN|nr:shikimate dehydrogenase [Actinomadura darangshiensis]TDD76852.1 shikimate dehydrogenase [Actinomadura darangshiensis]
MTGETGRRAAVLGSPVAHSLSPVLHGAAYAAMGLDDWSYGAVECGEDGLAALLGGLGPEWAGLSLTMPLKRVALDLVDTVSDLAVKVGGANTIVLRDGRRHGDNTDVYGIETALAEAGLKAPASALVLGGGATAASALAALARLGTHEAVLAVRAPERAAGTAGVGERFGLAVRVETLDRVPAHLPAELVVSTLPGRAADAFAGPVAESGAALFDVVYAPWPTALAAAVRRSGGTVVGGFAMLLHQAVRQVALMTGREDVPVAAMRAAGEAELARRA